MPPWRDGWEGLCWVWKMTKETQERWQIIDFFYRHLPLTLLKRQGTVFNDDMDTFKLWVLSSAPLGPYCHKWQVPNYFTSQSTCNLRALSGVAKNVCLWSCNHWINTGIEHGQYDGDFLCDCVLTCRLEDPSPTHIHTHSKKATKRSKILMYCTFWLNINLY